MVEFLFLDLDDTILDFKAQEDAAIQKTLLHLGIPPTLEICQRYSRINKDHWKQMEKGEITREQVLTGRFAVLFREFGICGDVPQTAALYMENLSQGHYFLPGAEAALQALSQKYRLYLASNGTAQVQHRRLESAGIKKYFANIFISQEIGINKPARGFFDACFAAIPHFRPDRAMMVGDSPSSDIVGGQNAQIATCWINPRRRTYPLPQAPDYEIESLAQLEPLLERI